MMPAPFLVQTDTFHNQVLDISMNDVGRCAAAHSHTSMELFGAFFCATHTHVSLVVAGFNYTSHIYKGLLLV